MRAEKKIYLGLLLWLSLFHPVLLFAGHGVEDSVDNLPADRVKQLMDAGEKLILIDMRPAKEYQQSRLPGALAAVRRVSESFRRSSQKRPRRALLRLQALRRRRSRRVPRVSWLSQHLHYAGRISRLGQTRLPDRDQPPLKVSLCGVSRRE